MHYILYLRVGKCQVRHKQVFLELDDTVQAASLAVTLNTQLLRKLFLVYSFRIVIKIVPILNPHPLHLKYSDLCLIFNDVPVPNLCGTIHVVG